MPGKRITNPSLINTTFPEAVANSAELLTDWNGLVWARPIPISMVGNSWFQGSYDNVTWDNYIKNDHNYLQVSTDGGITWRLIDLTGDGDDHPPVTIGNPWGGLKISGDDTQILTLEYVNYTDPGVMYPYDKWKLDQLRIDWLENLNTDYALYKDYVDSPDGLTRTHRLRTLSASTGISLSYDGDSIAISATPIAGTYSQGRNVATDGIGVFDANNDPYIDFRGLASLSDVLTITLDDTENDIDFDIIEENIDHNILENYVINEHIDHTTVSILTEEGIKGGGDITTTRTLSLDFPNLDSRITLVDNDLFAIYHIDEHYKIDWSDVKIAIKEYTDPFYVPITRAVHTGIGLRGGGVLNTDRTINLAFNDLPTVSFNPAEDYLAIYDGSNGNHAKILLSSVTSVNITKGNGMDFTAITSTGTIDMALPLTVTDSTTNSAGTPGTGHTHTLTIAELISIVDVDNSPVSGEYLKWNGTTWITDDPSIGATTPGLPLNSLQFNDASTFGGSAGLLYIESEDRIYFNAETDSTSGIIFGDDNISSPKVYAENAITSRLVLQAGVEVQDYVQILGGKTLIGQTITTGNAFLDIKDENISSYAYTLQIGTSFRDITLQLSNTGDLYLPELSSATEDNILYFDSVTGLVTWGAKPTTSGGGVQTLTADIVSGLTVNGGSTSSASTIDLDVNDSRLTPATIDLNDIIGFWDVSASGEYKQRKTTLAEFPGWNLSVDGSTPDEIKLGGTLKIDAGNNITLNYNDVTNKLIINSTAEGGVGDYPDLYINGISVEENFPTINFIEGSNITIDYENPGGVIIRANPYFPPYNHIPDSFIAMGRLLYSYDISEGTALQLINAPNSEWNSKTSFGDGNYIYTCTGTTLYRYNIADDYTESVQAGDTEILRLFKGSTRIYAISEKSSYYIFLSGPLSAYYYGNPRLNRDHFVNVIEVKDNTTGINYLLGYNDYDNRFYYKPIPTTFGPDSSMWTMSVKFLRTTVFNTTRMGDLVSQVSYPSEESAGFMIIGVDNLAWWFDDVHKFIGNTQNANDSFADRITHPYLLANAPYSFGEDYDNSDESAVYTKEITQGSPFFYANITTEGSEFYPNHVLDRGLYVSDIVELPINYVFEQAIRESIADVHVSPALLPGGTVSSYVMTGGIHNSKSRVGFRTKEDDERTFVSKDVLIVDNSLKHATDGTLTVSFVYYDETHTGGGLPPKDPTITTGVDLWVNDVEEERDITKLNLVEGTNVSLDYTNPGKVVINATGGGGGSDVESGNGMDFITNAPVTLGLPSTIDSTTENAVTETSHTHELGTINTDSVVKGKSVEYGALYNWFAVTDARKITSSNDWNVTTLAQWESLRAYIAANGWNYDGTTDAGTNESNKQGKAVALLTGWNSYFMEGNVGNTASHEANRNITGLSIKPAGWRYNSGAYANINKQSFFWCSDDLGGIYAAKADVNYDSSRLGTSSLFFKQNGISVRLVSDATGVPDGTKINYTGNNKIVYTAIAINGLYWLIENLNETKYRNGDWITGFDGGVYTPISDLDWAALTTEAMCYYDDDEEYGGGEVPLETLLHPPVTIHPDSASRASIDGNQVLTIEAQVGGQPYQVLTAKDIEAGTVQTYDLIIKCRQDITIESIVVECDSGTLTGCTVTIGATAITFASGTFSVSTTLTEIAATANNVASAGDRVKINTSTGYTGTPTVLNVQLNYTVN